MSNFKTKMVKGFNNMKFQAEKHSPEIHMALGVLAFAGTLVMVHKAAMKCEKVKEDHNERLEMIRTNELGRINGGETQYDSPDDAKHDKLIAYTRTAVDFGKTYAPVVALSSVSLYCFFKAYHIQKTRYLGAVAAFNAVSTAFSTYRKRVVDEQGEEADRRFMYGAEKMKVEGVKIDEKTGKEKKIKEDAENIDGQNVYCFDRVWSAEENPNFSGNHATDLFFLRAQEHMLNDTLEVKGHVFLNDVYDALGYERTPEGSVVGWISPEKGGVGYVDFGLNDLKSTSGIRKFINGNEDNLLLHFNHDGVIFEKI